MPPQRNSRSASVASDGGGRKRVIGANCAVPGCTNYAGKTRGKGVSYFKFPKGPTLQDLWANSIRRGGVWNPEKAHICSNHFKDDDFERDFKAELLGSKARKMLKPGVVPTQNLPGSLEEEDSQTGYASPNEDERSIVSSLPNDQIIVFEVGTSEDSMDTSACWDETNNPQSGDMAGEEVQDHPEDESKSLETPAANAEDIRTKENVDSVRRRAAENETKRTIITIAGCEQSEHLKAEISKLRMELKARDDSLFILEQSSALKAKQQLRIIGELMAENDKLKTELREKNEKITTLEEALATDTKLRSIFSPDELKRFLKKAKRWTEM